LSSKAEEWGGNFTCIAPMEKSNGQLSPISCSAIRLPRGDMEEDGDCDPMTMWF